MKKLLILVIAFMVTGCATITNGTNTEHHGHDKK